MTTVSQSYYCVPERMENKVGDSYSKSDGRGR